MSRNLLRQQRTFPCHPSDTSFVTAPRRAEARRSGVPSGWRLLEDRRLLATFNPLPSAVDGSPGSLRAAIIQANSDGQDNTINLQAGTYQLTIANSAGQENGAAQGDLDLTGAGHTITIDGPATGTAIIDGGQLDRVFQVTSGVTAILGHLTIQNGVARDAGNRGTLPGVEPAFGGGILNFGTTVLNDVVVQLNSALGGGGQNGSDAVGVGFTAATGGLSGLGGGIYNAGVLTMNQSIVRDNTAEGGSGGTGVNNADSLSVGGNGGAALGGGIFNSGALTINQSLIATNHAYGGAGGNAGNDYVDGFPGNNGGNGGDAYGGGIDIDGSSASVMVDRLDDRRKRCRGRHGWPGRHGRPGRQPADQPRRAGRQRRQRRQRQGGRHRGSIRIQSLQHHRRRQSKFQQLRWPGWTRRFWEPERLPGQHRVHRVSRKPAASGRRSTPTPRDLLTSVSSLIAMNLTTQYVAGSGVDSPSDVEATFANATDTLLQYADQQSVGITNGVDGDIVGVDPKLGPLQDNGGPTPTMALLPGSPAIDAGANPLGLTSDQRGYSPRVVGAAADIGAYELGANAPQGGGRWRWWRYRPGATSRPRSSRSRATKRSASLDPATGALKFIVFPFGKAYRGRFVISTADVNGDGIEDLIVRRPRGHHKFVTKIFSGLNGSILPSNLA